MGKISVYKVMSIYGSSIKTDSDNIVCDVVADSFIYGSYEKAKETFIKEFNTMIGFLKSDDIDAYDAFRKLDNFGMDVSYIPDKYERDIYLQIEDRETSSLIAQIDLRRVEVDTCKYLYCKLNGEHGAECSNCLYEEAKR